MTLTVGSLFAGIGGLELGLERAGMEVRWQVEKNEFCRKVLAKHWPDVPRYEDVRGVGADNLEDVDLICGGFPCQDISVAGQREGIDGDKSGLWSEMHRIVCEVRPQYVFVENVSALLVRGIDRVLGDLAEGGYDAEWDCIPAVAVGAPHRRDRAFVVAYPPDSRVARRLGVPADGQEKGQRRRVGREGGAGNSRGEALDNSDKGRYGAPQKEVRPGWIAPQLSGWWETEPGVGRVAHGVPDRVDRIRALGNAVVPQVAEWIGRRIIAAHERAEAA